MEKFGKCCFDQQYCDFAHTFFVFVFGLHMAVNVKHIRRINIIIYRTLHYGVKGVNDKRIEDATEYGKFIILFFIIIFYEL